MVTLYWSADNLIWRVSVDHNMMSFIHKVHGKPRLHVSANLLFRAWPPSSPPCAPVSNTASHDNREKINSWVSFTFYGYGAPLGGPWGRRRSANIQNRRESWDSCRTVCVCPQFPYRGNDTIFWIFPIVPCHAFCM